MSVSNANNPSLVVVPLGVVSSTTTFKAAKISKPMHLKTMHILDVTGVAADDTNYLVITVQQGSTVYGTLSTKLTGGDGAIPANSWLSKSASIDAMIPAGLVDVVVTKFGTAALAAASKIELEVYG